jgi:hypothetical protein
MMNVVMLSVHYAEPVDVWLEDILTIQCLFDEAMTPRVDNLLIDKTIFFAVDQMSVGQMSFDQTTLDKLITP